MEKIAISKFKATCLAVLDQVRKTGRPVQITRFGKPIAEVVPATPSSRPEGWLGCMSDRGSIRGDIISPAGSADEWEVQRR